MEDQVGAGSALPVPDIVNVEIVYFHCDGVINRLQERLLVDRYQVEITRQVTGVEGEGLGIAKGFVVDQGVDVLQTKDSHLIDECIVPVGVLQTLEDEVVPLSRHDFQSRPALRFNCTTLSALKLCIALDMQLRQPADAHA